MAVGNHLRLCASSRPWKKIFTPLAPSMAYLRHAKRYTQRDDSEDGHGGLEERAPSTAEEFKRVAEEKVKEAEEKLKEAEQGVASQVFDKTYDGTEEAVLGDANPESVKKRYEQHEENADYRRRG
ncbi:hypothetical protein EUGRSUZ_F03493 [Eucalyptus grandis]|uniref:Uncharacterized protein n=2 Tax=Eucalyptus grandis TaxID=71139 RepID=A0ACC3KMF2_EUCGR|nr:hypothetical protein EUGRSUZ_F03493 [Eucalyptus grandis]